MDKRKEIYKELHAKYPDFVWKPYMMPILRLVTPIIRKFPVETIYEDNIPNDGVYLFVSNHQGFFDALSCNSSMKYKPYFCIAGDENFGMDNHIGPRGTINGLAAEARGVCWVDRDNKQSRINSSMFIKDCLMNGISVGICPEGIWNLSDHKLILHFSRGAFKNAIEISKYRKVYILVCVIDYEYNHNSEIVKSYNRILKPIEVSPKMDVVSLTEYVEDLFWSNKWEQMEARAIRSKETVFFKSQYGANYVWKRENLNIEDWNKHIDKIKSKFNLDYEKESTYEVLSKEQKLQKEVSKYLSNCTDICSKKLKKIKK